MRAETADLYQMLSDAKSVRQRGAADTPLQRRIGKLGEVLAPVADQHEARVVGTTRTTGTVDALPRGMVVNLAGGIGLQRVDAMYQPGIKQEIERAIDGYRRGIAALQLQPVEQIVCADRRGRRRDQLVHLATERREGEALVVAESLGGLQGTCGHGAVCSHAEPRPDKDGAGCA